jgi:putative transposase
MRQGSAYQPLSYDIRLPDDIQADALRLLEVSREAINVALVQLWPHLDAFMQGHPGPAWKQAESFVLQRSGHGNRLERCELEQAGRIMRAQAERKQVYLLVVPILSEGFIRPKEEKRPAGKNRKLIKEAITALQKTLDGDETSFVTMQNVVEQCCNFFLREGRFPTSYEELQPIPLLSVGLLTYAGDDGGAAGQAYRLAFDLDQSIAVLSLRVPDEQGMWPRDWFKRTITLLLPPCVVERLRAGVQMAPTLREHRLADGSRIAILDVMVQVKQAEMPAWSEMERVLGFDWGVHSLITAVVLQTNPADPEHPLQISRPLFVNTGGLDGHQARTRRQIDQLKAVRDTLLPADPKRAVYEEEIQRCWRLYEARNRELAHLAANLLLLFASVWGCSLISGESLKTLKSTGRGKGVRGKWRNWRNNTTIRSEIWRILRYKSHLCGIRFRSEKPRGTSHTCPRCGKEARTYRSPRPHHRNDPVKWGRWLCCSNPACLYNADRDYCAAINIARLGIAYLIQIQRTGKGKAFSVTEMASVKPRPYIARGAVLLFPPHTDITRLLDAGKLYINGWKRSVTLRSSYATPLLLRLCS